VTTVAGQSSVCGYVDGSGTNAQFSTPQFITASSSGALYITDNVNHMVRKVLTSKYEALIDCASSCVVLSTDGAVSLFAGGGTSGYKDGTGSDALFNFPAGIAVDASGNLFVGDFSNFVVRKISASSVVTTFVGSGGVAGLVDGFGTVARFSNIFGVCVDTYGRLFVADTGNKVIRVVESSGECACL
jgi:sugar lactone lactonase YvrE